VLYFGHHDPRVHNTLKRIVFGGCYFASALVNLGVRIYLVFRCIFSLHRFMGCYSASVPVVIYAFRCIKLCKFSVVLAAILLVPL